MESGQRCVLVILLLGLVSAGRANDSRAVEPAAPAGHDLEIELDHPAPDQDKRPEPSVEVSDRADTPPFVASDVVIVIDNSTLSLVASGIDVDQDGVVGRNRISVTHMESLAPPAQFWTTDADDTVHALQLRVARALVPRLAARQNNVGLTSFTLREIRQGQSPIRLTNEPEVLVPVGSPGAVSAALADFPPAHERRRTDLDGLLERAALLLDVAAASDFETRRPRAILLLWVGEPSAPDGIHWSSRRALERAYELGERSIPVWAIPFRPGSIGYLDELTRRSGGRVIPLNELDTRFGALSR